MSIARSRGEDFRPLVQGGSSNGENGGGDTDAKGLLKAQAFGLLVATICYYSGFLSVPVMLGLVMQALRLAYRAYNAYFLAEEDHAVDPIVHLHRAPRLMASRLSSLGFSSRALSHA